MSRVLVTGGSGFVGSHLIVKLLRDGHSVRTTVRSVAREPEVLAMMREGGCASDIDLTFNHADLSRDDGWAAAVNGCEYVYHVASPFPAKEPEDENDLIIPARDGTLRVLRAARDAGVKRLVLTSSFAAIGYGHANYDKVFVDGDWSDPSGPDVKPYIKSKTLAERAAWDFIEREGGDMEFTVVNPVGVFGPALGPNLSASVAMIKQLLDGFPPPPNMYFGVVDVRDLADLHVRAMNSPAAIGQRFLGVGGDVTSLVEIAEILRAGLGPIGAMVQIGERDSPEAEAPVRRSTSEKARAMLGWKSRPLAETIADSAKSLQRLGLLVPN